MIDFISHLLEGRKTNISLKKLIFMKMHMDQSRPKLKLNIKTPTSKYVPPNDDIDDLLSFPLLDLRKCGSGIGDVSVNSEIVDMLTSLISHSEKVRTTMSSGERSSQTRRINSFIKGRDAIKSCSKKITSGSQAKRDIAGVGAGIAKRIDEFIKTGKLAEMDEQLDPAACIIQNLCTITGIGEAKATTLMIDHGVTSVADLIDKCSKGIIQVAKNQLTHHIAVGLKYYYDLEKRMPWDEAHQIAEKVKYLIHDADPDLIVMVCGSYRRHKPTCGDLDVLVTRKDDSGPSQLSRIVTNMEKKGLLVGHLTTHGQTKYMGVCKLNPDSIGRRIDIRYVPYSSMGAATLYFTGSGKFNKIMRFKANQRGYTLNEYGLYHYINGIKGDIVHAPKEMDIFKILNFIYLDPKDREF